ncbi:MAG TPA: potassium-transporting ATPase subunit KdpC [Candidatus Binataceae bacterium]|nr:potassium-transporting ATPase subunit KdpC [Candidatus Binataceae bacterium]
MRLWTAIKMTVALTILTGIIYPLVVAGIARVVFPYQAAGSLIVRNGQVIGSEMIGQNFSLPQYFHPRPSAAGDKGYDATSSGGSNLGPTNHSLIDTVKLRLKEVLEKNPGSTAAAVPIDMVTASGSGLDSEISPADAGLQADRVAKARGLGDDAVQGLIRTHTRARWAGLFGEPGVNVLELNLALDSVKPVNATAMAGTATGKP